MHITHATRDGCLVVALTGKITLSTAPQIRRALLKDLAEQPLAVICDLGGVDTLDPICSRLFASVANHPVSRWPPTSLLLCGAQPAVAEVLGSFRVGHFLPQYDTLQEALDEAVDRPRYLRQELRLGPTPTAAVAARRFVRDTLQLWRWGPPDPDGELSEQAQLLAVELVTNAVVHAQTDLRLRLELGGELLHVAVRDFDRRLPRPLPDNPQGEAGRGLRLVARLATAWGARPHPGGGKVVWCTLRASRVAPSRRPAGGPSFPILEPKLAPPLPRRGLVPRTSLLGRLTATSRVPLVVLVAPPGYGKTTLLAQWVEQDRRPFVWLSVDQHDNDPVVLLSHLAAALDRVDAIDPAVFGALAAPGTSVLATVMPRLGAALATAARPLVVVLDDIHLLDNQDCLDVLVTLVDHLGERSQLVVAGRRAPAPVPRLRAEGRVAELGPEALAMDRHEAAALLQAAELQLSDAEVADLVRRTEGWPLALYLAALSMKATGSKPGAAAALGGFDRLLVEYLQSGPLSGLSPGTVRFLTRTAVLDRLSGPLCDAILDTTGSAETLERLERSNLLVVPLDGQRQWYRYHHLFRELLRAELERREPELVGELARRAAAWCERHDLPEATLDYAMQAGDTDHVAGLLVRLAFPVYYSGRLATLQRWFDWFEDHQLLERYPAVAVLGAWLQALLGHAAAAERWADTAERGAPQEAGTLSDGSASIDGWLALLRAVMCRNGVERLRSDAELACKLVPTGSRLRAPAVLLLGISHLLVGAPDRADRLLAEAVEVAEDTKATDIAAIALAERALVAIDRGDWDKAELLAEHGRSLLRQAHLDDYVTNVLLYAVAARLAVHRGDLAGAHADLARAQRLRPQLTVALPIYAVQARLELVAAYLALTDVAGANTVLREVDELLRHRPHLGVLGQQADHLRARVDTMRADVLGASSLTAAELRLLPLLTTHLTFREIGERRHVSPHTVKTQAMSIYHKLGVSSRSQAIQHAQQLGLLPA